MAQLDRIFGQVVKWIKKKKKQDTNTEGETPENTNRTKNDPTKRQPSEKTCDKIDGFEKLASNDIFDGKKVPFNASIHQIKDKGFSNAKRRTKKFDKQKKQKRKHF